MPDAAYNALERCTLVTDTGSPKDDPRQPIEGIALCLSDRGYRAMLFQPRVSVPAERVRLSEESQLVGIRA